MDQDKLNQILPEKEPVVTPKNGYKIPVCTPYLSDKEISYLQLALNSTNISGGAGDFIPKFEKLFAQKTGAKYAVACNSGTSALHVAYRLIGIKPGDKVIVPDFTMVSTVTPLIEMGAEPIFVDCDESGQIDVRKIEQIFITNPEGNSIKAIVATHIYGHPVDIDKIEELAKKYSLQVIYDAAEAHGAEYKKKKLGEFGDVCCYSFYANKIITTGEGGMVTFNNQEFVDMANRLVDEFFSYERHFWHTSYGYSYRMSNLLAAIGFGQTERMDDLIKNKRKNYDFLKENLSNVEGLSFIPDYLDVNSVRWVNGILIDKEKFGLSRNGLRKALGEWGIETRPFFIPMHLQPCMSRFLEQFFKEFPVAEKWCAQGMYLPSSSALSIQGLERIQFVIKEIKRSL